MFPPWALFFFGEIGWYGSKFWEGLMYSWFYVPIVDFAMVCMVPIVMGYFKKKPVESS